MNKLNKEFLERLSQIYTNEEIEIIKNGFNTKKRKPSFRINTLKAEEKDILRELEQKGLKAVRVKFLKDAYVLDNGTEKDLWELDVYKNGKIYLQSISSQMPAHLLDISDFDKVLDITASPGGKTSQVSALLKNTGEVVANDNNQIRIDKLNFNLNKQGCRNVAVIKNDARLIGKKYPEYIGYFNKIIADLPCSAEGKFNTHKEKSYGFWNLGVVKRNYKLQKDIIKAIIPLLKDNGIILYSTCTLAPEENEAMVHMILSNFPELEIQEINIDYKYIKAGIKKFGKKVFRNDVSKSIRILPSPESEGFFVAKFKKTVKI